MARGSIVEAELKFASPTNFYGVGSVTFTCDNNYYYPGISIQGSVDVQDNSGGVSNHCFTNKLDGSDLDMLIDFLQSVKRKHQNV